MDGVVLEEDLVHVVIPADAARVLDGGEPSGRGIARSSREGRHSCRNISSGFSLYGGSGEASSVFFTAEEEGARDEQADKGACDEQDRGRALRLQIRTTRKVVGQPDLGAVPSVCLTMGWRSKRRDGAWWREMGGGSSGGTDRNSSG